RVTWVIPVVLSKRLPRPDRMPEEKELWARAIVTLFVPWRTPADLKLPEETWTEAYERFLPRIASQHRNIIHNMSVLSECKDARDK
ncbi:hypothetical protein OH76DRAFT_1315173, partial [Lentinus brumalis]